MDIYKLDFQPFVERLKISLTAFYFVYFTTVFHRQQRSKHCKILCIGPKHQSAVYSYKALGLVWTHLHESRVLRMSNRFVITIRNCWMKLSMIWRIVQMTNGGINLREERWRPDFYSVVPDSILRSVYWLEFLLVVSNSTPRSFYSKLNCLQIVGFLTRCLICNICLYRCLWVTIITTRLTEIVSPM